jgi:hypothetical protein
MGWLATLAETWGGFGFANPRTEHSTLESRMFEVNPRTIGQ